MCANFWGGCEYKHKVTVKVKQSRNRPGVTRRLPGVLGSQIFMTIDT